MLVHQRVIPSKEQNQSWNRPWNLTKSLALSGLIPRVWTTNQSDCVRDLPLRFRWSQLATVSQNPFIQYLSMENPITKSLKFIPSPFPLPFSSSSSSSSYSYIYTYIFFPTCQVRVVIFYHPAPMSSESQRSPWSPRFKVWEESSGSIFELDFSSPLEAPSARRRRNAPLIGRGWTLHGFRWIESDRVYIYIYNMATHIYIYISCGIMLSCHKPSGYRTRFIV